jgi:hypothetical protein
LRTANLAASPHRIWFVHGVTGNSRKTWTHPETKRFWPDFVAKDFPQARIITFGYDANIIGLAKGLQNAQNSSIRSYGLDLASTIRNLRQNVPALADVPIYFIAHSMGGLVVEQALLLSIGAEQSLHSVAKATSGILFMGTPHEGSRMARLPSLLRDLIPRRIRDTNKTVLNALKPDSEVCKALGDQFNQQVKHGKTLNHVRLFSFYETVKMRGFKDFIVPEESSSLAADFKLPIAGTHTSMVQFPDDKDSEYAKVKGQLNAWLLEDKPDAAVPLPVPPAAAVAAAKANPTADKAKSKQKKSNRSKGGMGNVTFGSHTLSNIYNPQTGAIDLKQTAIAGSQYNQHIASGGTGSQNAANEEYGQPSEDEEDGYGQPSDDEEEGEE